MRIFLPDVPVLHKKKMHTGYTYGRIFERGTVAFLDEGQWLSAEMEWQDIADSLNKGVLKWT